MASASFYGDTGQPQTGAPVFDQSPDESSSPHVDDPNNPPQLAASPEPTPPSLPFFTLVEDSSTAEYHHPTVHYIFADDDTEILTEAGLRSLDQADMSGDDQHNDPEATTLLPPPIPGIEDNYVVLDIEPVPPTSTAGVQGPVQQTSPVPGATPARPQPQYRVSSSQSLSSSWQALQSELVPAPTFENGDPSQPASQGLMLKIRGADRLPGVSTADNREKTARLENMMDHFSKKMIELRAACEEAGLEGGLGDDAQIQTGGQKDEPEHGDA